MGAKYEIDEVGKIEQNTNVSFSRYLSKDFSNYSKTMSDDSYTHQFSIAKLNTETAKLEDFIKSCDENQMIILDGSASFEFTKDIKHCDKFEYDFGDGMRYFRGLHILDNTPKYQTRIDVGYTDKIIVLNELKANTSLPTVLDDETLSE